MEAQSLVRTAKTVEEAIELVTLELGVDRLSIGFQSLRPETLELFGRVHSVEQSFSASTSRSRVAPRARYTRGGRGPCPAPVTTTI